MVQEIYTTKNKLVDKTWHTQYLLEDLIGQSFLFSKGDQKWKTIRKACAHAFYKERLAIMMLVLKEKLDIWIDKRNGEIEASAASD